MIKVLLVNARYHPGGIGGAARFVQILAEAMARAGDSVLVACRGAVPRPLRHELNGVVVWRLPFAMTDVEAAQAVGSLVAQERPDAVHTNFLKGFDRPRLAQILADYAGRVVHTLHEYSLLCAQGLLFRDGRICETVCPSCRLVAETARPFVARVDFVAGVSRHVLERHRAAGLFGDARRVCVIPNAYDPPAGAFHRSPLGPVLRFGYLGRLAEEKGLMRLLETVVGLPSHLPAELLVAGRVDSAFAQEARRRFEGPRVRFLGYTDPEEFFPRIDVLVFPSLCEETFGRGVIEGFAYGVPAVVSNLGGLPELLVPGRTGWICPAEAPDALRDTVLGVLRARDLVPSMAAGCRQAARTFTTERVLGEYRRLYSVSADAPPGR